MTTDLNALLAQHPAQPENAVTLVRSEPRHRHSWRTAHIGPTGRLVIHLGLGHIDCRDGAYCRNCLAIRDCTASRRGRSSDRLGKDNERRIQRVYGPRKVGQYGDPVDHVVRVWKWQSRATRTTPQLWLSRIDEPISLPDPPEWVTVPLNAMQPYYPELAPLLVRSFVQRGVGTRDWIFLRGIDWVSWAGGTLVVGIVVMRGERFLEQFGLDGPKDV